MTVSGFTMMIVERQLPEICESEDQNMRSR